MYFPFKASKILFLQIQCKPANHICFIKERVKKPFANRVHTTILILQNKTETMAKDITYLEILDRDNRKCRNCGSGQNLEVHHRQYHRDNKTGLKREPWDYDNKFLITICHGCHEIGHEQYKIPVFNN